MEKVPTKKQIYNLNVPDLLRITTTKKPIYKGCRVIGQCFCTGDCQEIVGWEEIRNFTPIAKL